MLLYQYINVFLRQEDLGRIKKIQRQQKKNMNRSTWPIQCAPILDDFILMLLFSSFMYSEGLTK